MKKEIITQLAKNFEDYAHEYEGTEFWYARDLQKLLDYTKWDNFLLVIEKAKKSCNNAGHSVSDHFADVGNMINIGKGAKREINDIMLTRYACYLIAQNGDPKKEQIAFAQSYFALQTRKQEIIEERLKLEERLRARKKLTETEALLSRLIYEHGVDEKGFGRIRSQGDQALFGGLNTSQMKGKLGAPDNRPLADFLPTITIKAKDFATEITNFNVTRDNLMGEADISEEHVRNNKDVRDLLGKSNIKPEELPPEEDIKKLERRILSEDKRLPANTKKLNLNSNKEEVSETIRTEEPIATISEKNQIRQINWPEVLQELKRQGRMSLYSNLIGTRAVLENNVVCIGFNPGSQFCKMLVSKAENLSTLEACISNTLCLYGFSIKVVDISELDI